MTNARCADCGMELASANEFHPIEACILVKAGCDPRELLKAYLAAKQEGGTSMNQDFQARILDEVLSLSPRPSWVNDLLAKHGLSQAVPFWNGKSFEELASEQGVHPVDDVGKLSQDWPEGADFDSFEKAVRSARG